MTKNYFTDEQVKEALEKLGMRRPFSSHSLQHYKNLMNLAVETAIGEPKAWLCEESGKLTLDQYENSNSSYMQLYSVKELDN